MDRQQSLSKILNRGILAVVRLPERTHISSVVQALLDGGIDVIEITLSVPDALEAIRDTQREFGDRILLGAGTVLDPESARAAIFAGAEYIVSPTLNLDVIRLCHRYDKMVIPGAFTPTEIQMAWEAGADIVKVFPAESVGPSFFRAMHGPLPQIRIMATGNIGLGRAQEYLEAGACCLGIASNLVDPVSIAEKRFGAITELARKFSEVVRKARSDL